MSEQDGITRRDTFRRVLVTGAAAAVWLRGGASGEPIAVAAEAGGYEILSNAFGFSVAIDGFGAAADGIREVALAPLSVDCLATTDAAGERLYGPGKAHWGSARFTSACTLGGSKELQQWWQESAKRGGAPRDIVVTLLKSDGTPGRTYTLRECFPVQWSSVNFDTSSSVQTETLTVKIGRIEFTT